MELGAAKIRALKLRDGEIRPLELRAVEICSLELRAGKICPLEPRALEIRPLKLRAGLRSLDCPTGPPLSGVALGRARAPEVSIADVRGGRVCPFKVSRGEVCLSQDSADQHQAFEMTCTE